MKLYVGRCWSGRGRWHSKSVITATLALSCALAYGVSDFLGAVGARRLRVLTGTTVTYLFALGAIFVALPFVGGAWSLQTIAWGTVAGVAAIAGFLAFYAALAAGPMSLATPLIAMIGALVPVIAAVALGEQLTPVAWLAILIAVVGAGMISVSKRGAPAAIPRKTVLLAVVAGVMLGAAIVALDRAPHDSGATSAFVDVFVGVVLLGMLQLTVTFSGAVRRRLSILDEEHEEGTVTTPGRARLASAVGGILLGIGNVLLLAALQSGSLAVVSVLAGLYPVATVILARLVYRESLSAVQWVGVLLALLASVLLALA